jgi:hypothetical protein
MSPCEQAYISLGHVGSKRAAMPVIQGVSAGGEQPYSGLQEATTSPLAQERNTIK